MTLKRASVGITIVLAASLLVGQGRHADFLPDLNKPGWCSFAYVTGSITNWRDQNTPSWFYDMAFAGTLYYNRQTEEWCINADRKIYDQNRNLVEENGLCQWRINREKNVVEIRRGLIGYMNWFYGFWLHLAGQMDFTIDSQDKTINANYIYCTGYGASPQGYNPQRGFEGALVTIALHPPNPTLDASNFSAEMSSSDSRNTASRTSYGVDLNVARAYNLPCTFNPSLETWEYNRGSNQWELRFRNPMTIGNNNNYFARNLVFPQSGSYVFLIREGEWKIAELNPFNVNTIPETTDLH